MSKKLQELIKTNRANVAVVGLGYVGLPLAVAFAQKGFSVMGVDVSVSRIARIKDRKSYILDVTHEDIDEIVGKGKFTASTDFVLLQKADVVIICVPTPIKRRYTPDISFMLSAVRSVAKYIKKDMLVILESTTYPGTTEELIKPELESNGLKAGRDFHLAFSPERIDPDNPTYKVTDIPKVVGGFTAGCTALTALLYGKIINDIHQVSSPRAAEMTKLLENTFRIINIGWINEAAMMCHKMGINCWEVIDAAKTKPFGFMPFYPGLGVGGHCIPEDPLYLYWKAKRYGFSSRFIKLSADLNHHMPDYVISRMEEIIKARKNKLDKCRILVVGITYKKNVKDLRKSPALRLIELLQKKCKVDYSDPFVPYLDIDRLKMKSVEITPKAIRGYDMVVIAVDHDALDYELISRNAKIIFDLKNVYKRKPAKNIVVL